MDKQNSHMYSSIENFYAKEITGIQFSAREVEILTLIAKAMNNEQIAKTLNISIRTVEWHKSNIMKKTNVKSAVSLIAFARNAGL
jgi:DNA-binding NarL/FixJ family response regulator